MRHNPGHWRAAPSRGLERAFKRSRVGRWIRAITGAGVDGQAAEDEESLAEGVRAAVDGGAAGGERYVGGGGPADVGMEAC